MTIFKILDRTHVVDCVSASRSVFKMLVISGVSATIVLGAGSAPIRSQELPAGVSPELGERMAKEKEARRVCKVSICKAFAEPDPAGAPIVCDVTKTWLKQEILGRVTGGSWVWGYGHMQCSMKLDLDRQAIAKAATEAAADVSFPEHTLVCNVEKSEPSEGQAFTVKVSLTPAAKFVKGQATNVALEPVKTEGSTAASAAVTAMMAADQVSGIVSRAVAGEINTFLFDKCKADGVEITRKN